MEGSTAAGPIGGTDIRAAQLPPPGLYGIGAVAYGENQGFNDGNGDSDPVLNGLEQRTATGGGALLYVPDFEVFGGNLGFVGLLRASQQCGRLFANSERRCIEGFGDPYVEVDWSRFFGEWRPSKYDGAYPIPQGLTLQLGLGVVIPLGRYSAEDARTSGVTIGNNIWDVAPSLGFTYVTPPIIADGTELSSKIFFNNYFENPETDYQSGSLVNVDFALTEKIGKFQVGLAGLYAVQVEDDEQFGVRVGSDGRRARVLSLGGVAAYDMPEYGAAVKLKGVTTIVSQNTVNGFGIALTFIKKLY
ncbi:MAG: transporter [Pseudomonadota bacterium]